MAAMSEIRHDWTRQQVLDLLGLPFADLMQRAHAGDQQLPMWADIWTAIYQALDD